jgi:hypothetical protein
MDLSSTVVSLEDLSGGTPPPPQILLTELLDQVSVLQQQEASDRTLLAALSVPALADIRAKMTTWVAGGLQGSCDLVRIGLAPPNVCSDGVSRNLYEYIVFLSGKTLVEHLRAFQDLLPEFEVGYRCSRVEILVCVVRLKA